MKKHIVSIVIACAISLATGYSQTNGDTGPATANPPQPTVWLKDAFAGKFLIGTASDLRGLPEAALANIRSNYNIITPENCMKPQSLHPAENTYDWATADAMVKWCQDNNIKVWAHNLCWHTQTGRWMLQGTNGQPITRELAMARLQSHILTVAGHFKGKVMGWDVVNEAIDDRANHEPANLRNDTWYKAIGADYLTMAFKWAHEADPDAQLYYNDYNIEQGAVTNGGKHANSMILLKQMIKDGAPINGVGIQGHWHLDTKLDDVEKAISDYESLGLKVSISELDVTAVGGNSGAFGGGGGGGGAVTPAALQKQAEIYAQLFEIFNRHAKTISRVTLWGIDDNRSWRRGQAALVFDGQLQPKPAFKAIVDVGLGKYVSPQN